MRGDGARLVSGMGCYLQHMELLKCGIEVLKF